MAVLQLRVDPLLRAHVPAGDRSLKPAIRRRVRKALEKNDRNPQARYNLGNSLLAQNKDSAAVTEFEKASKIETDPLLKSQSFHNMGVICQKHEMFGEAIEAYKQSLRLNPHDDETRYNLQLCKHKLKKQQQDKKNQPQEQKQDQKQDQKQQEQQKPEPQKQQQPPQMSKDNAEQLLNAAMQQEKQTQDRMKKAQQQPRRRQLQKNW